MNRIVGYIKDSETIPNYYPVIRVGLLCYLGASLRVTKYRDGRTIESTHIQQSPDTRFPHLYKWQAAFPKAPNETYPGNIYPYGVRHFGPRHLQIVWAALGSARGGKLKATSLWKQPNTGARDSISFKATPDNALGEKATIWIPGRLVVYDFISAFRLVAISEGNVPLFRRMIWPFWPPISIVNFGLTLELHHNSNNWHLIQHNHPGMINHVLAQVRGHVYDLHRIINPKDVPFSANVIDTDPLFYAGGL